MKEDWKGVRGSPGGRKGIFYPLLVHKMLGDPHPVLGVVSGWELLGWGQKWQACLLPDGLVLQPASITLLIACLIGSLELLRRGNHCPGEHAGLLCLLECQRVSGGTWAIVEYNPWGRGEGRKKWR